MHCVEFARKVYPIQNGLEVRMSFLNNVEESSRLIWGCAKGATAPRISSWLLSAEGGNSQSCWTSKQRGCSRGASCVLNPVLLLPMSYIVLCWKTSSASTVFYECTMLSKRPFLLINSPLFCNTWHFCWGCGDCFSGAQSRGVGIQEPVQGAADCHDSIQLTHLSLSSSSFSVKDCDCSHHSVQPCLPGLRYSHGKDLILSRSTVRNQEV